ncbi:multidrug resistance protein CDR1 [Lojkania enalia]|uniref:Multidrug resistance protein CDR1 n=1 Tax=Lojkania enalia TaxID=147567 RepID=A0A9P4KET1_9PLEO|nr:multidrug resistance protein CDR1 [Didymosphaeria enalia]
MDDKRRMRSGVSFQNLNVFGLNSADDIQYTVASYFAAIPKFIVGFFRQATKSNVHILHDFDGAVRDGEMLLVLGRPGSGCSTLLKVLAGETLGLHVDASSKILYDGISRSKEKYRLKGHAIYLSELDVHFPELTLGQTLTFAAATQNTGSTASSHAQKIGREVAAMFELDAALNTPVGNTMIRGISGGEKRRTSIAEVFISSNWLQCWDNSTRGLDSSTALSFVELLKSSTVNTQSTVIMSIYQASNAIYEKFDRVTLLYGGYQIYFGPTELAAEYFVDLGFEKPPRATIADFLTSITYSAERRIRAGYEDRAPRSAEEFASAWKRSNPAKRILEEIDSFGSTGQVDRAPDHMSRHATYKISIGSQVCLCVVRGLQRLRNNYVPIVAGLIGNTIVAIVVGSVYYDLTDDTTGMDKRAVLVFFSLMINAYAPAFEVLAMWAQRPIVEKHHRYAFYRPFTESIASLICDLPNKLATAIMFNIPLYFMTNLRRSSGAFFTYLAFMICIILTMSMFFRMVGSLTRTIEQSMVPCSLAIITFSSYTGFVIPVKDMVPWMAWLRRINPIAFAYESLMINEFANRRFPCSRIIPSGIGYNEDTGGSKICAVIGAAPGQIVIDGSAFISKKYGYHADHLWRNMGIMLAMLIVFCAIHLVATEYIPAQQPRGEILLFQRKGGKSPKLGKNEESGISSTVLVSDSPQHSNIEILDVERKAVDHIAGTGPLPLEGRSVFHWSNLNYSIKIKKHTRQILHDVEGWVRPGTLTALMGVTGAGKTSLLDILASRTRIGELKGDIYLGSEKPDTNFQRKIGYVQQEDIHLSTSTIREALEFSAKLRNPQDTLGNRMSHIQYVLELLEMTPYSDAVVGVPGEGLNVEQRKRLSIAVEMVAKPELLLFLDEPTSGLDSQTAWSICMLLRKLANNGHAILVTIHQPSSQLFELFDRLLLLDKSGRVTYFGEIGNDASTLISYFERNGNAQCDPTKNPAEWILNMTSHAEEQNVLSKSQAIVWNEVWAQSIERQDVLREIATFKEIQQAKTKKYVASYEHKYAAPFSTQLYEVTRRIFQQYWRDPIYLYSKGALCAGVTLMNGLSFLNTDLNIQGISNIFFSVFLFTQLFSTIDQQVIPRLVEGRSLFEARERRSKSYSWTVFIAANICVELFWQTIASVLVFFTWYYPTGLWRNGDPSFPSVERGGLAFGMICLFCLWISTFSQAVGVAIDHAETSVQIATLFFWLSLVFCGVLVSPKDIPKFWHFVYRVSPLTYFIDGTVIAGLANTEIRCSTVEMLHVVPPAGKTCNDYLMRFINAAGGYLRNPGATVECDYCPVSTTNMLLIGTGISVSTRWHNFAYMFVYVAFNVLAIFVIYWVARERGLRAKF